MQHNFAMFNKKNCNLRRVHFTIWNKYISPFWTNTFVNKRPIHFAISDKYISQFNTKTFCNLGQLHFTIGENIFLNFRKVHSSILVWSGDQTDHDQWPYWPDISFPCMEYKTDGDRAVKHEEWPISSFGPPVSQSRWSVQEMLAHLKISMQLNVLNILNSESDGPWQILGKISIMKNVNHMISKEQ